LCVADDIIYYSIFRSGGGLTPPSIFRIKTDGTKLPLLVNDPHEENELESFVIDGDWVYYVLFGSNSGGMYKIKNDGTENTKLINLNEQVFNINTIDDVIYYSGSESIYKMKSDGSDKVQLTKNKSGFINIVGCWIYSEATVFEEGQYKGQELLKIKR
jgi:Tol biopolymer transport system component